MTILRTTWRQPIGLPATRWMVELGARMLGAESELVLKSRRVVSRRLEQTGFEFLYPGWEAAAANLYEEITAW
jgi:uncharacterized protein